MVATIRANGRRYLAKSVDETGKTHYKNIPVSREIIMSNRGYKQDISMGRNYNAFSLVDEIRIVTAVLLVKAQCHQPNRIHHPRCLFAKGQMRYCYSTGLMS